MTQREEFISRIAQKLGRPTPTSVEPVEVSFPLFRLNSQEERVEEFLKMYEIMGGNGAKARTTEEAVSVLKNWFGEKPDWLNNQSIVTWDELPTMARACLEELKWTAYTYSELPSNPEERNPIMDKMELGITGADYAIVQSGSLILKSSPKRGRAVSLIPTRHLTFVAASTILDSLDQAMEKLASSDVPAAIEIISGPSRTSDIEMDLSIGVHGPVEVYTIVMLDQ
ncbi:MAG: LUD domain-containing protein [Desulfitobacterium sp.]|nr:LUD domain-containing protein [Desulfitobacterium sp.]